MEAFKLLCLSNLSDFSWLAGFSMLVTAFGMCAIPFCKQALLLTGLMSSIGMSMGVLDTGKSTLGYILLRVHSRCYFLRVVPRHECSPTLSPTVLHSPLQSLPCSGISRKPKSSRHSTTLPCKHVYRRLQQRENIAHT